MSRQESPEHHTRFMRSALRLASRGRGRVSPNPLVGAVVVRDGQVVGEGYHLYDRRAHAETVALDQAGEQARGADLYVTLEPCFHHGRTPPCVGTILNYGIRRVFVAVEDPNPLVNGQGIGHLRENGVEVVTGLCREEARDLNRFFFHVVESHRPFVSLKLALSLDGRIAARGGASKWITGERARQYVHRLRFEHDAVLAGVGTVLADDPSLDVRWNRRKRITKIVLDSELRTPSGSRLFESNDPVMIFHSEKAAPERQASLREKATLLSVPSSGGILDWESILEELGRAGISSLLVEGGGRVAGTLVEGGWVNAFYLFYAPLLLGSFGVSSIQGLEGVLRPGSAPSIEITRLRKLGTDFVVEGKPLAIRG